MTNEYDDETLIELATLAADIGPVEWGLTNPMSATEHGKMTKRSVKITAETHNQIEDQAMQCLFVEGTKTVLCLTGTSPNSPNTARLLTGLWNKFVADSREMLGRD